MNNNWWKDLLASFNIFGYSALAKKSPKEAAGSFMLIYSFAFIVALLIAIPALVNFPTYIERELAKVDVFTIDVKYNSTDSIDIPERDPFVTISSTDTETNSNIVITKKTMTFNFLPGIAKSYEISKFKDLKKNRDEISKVFIVLLVLLAPSLLIAAYGFNLIKYVGLMLVISLIIKLVLSVSKRKIKYKKLLSVGFYSLIPLILVEMILIPLNIPSFFIPVIVYIIWYTVISIEIIEDF